MRFWHVESRNPPREASKLVRALRHRQRMHGVLTSWLRMLLRVSVSLLQDRPGPLVRFLPRCRGARRRELTRRPSTRLVTQRLFVSFGSSIHGAADLFPILLLLPPPTPPYATSKSSPRTRLSKKGRKIKEHRRLCISDRPIGSFFVALLRAGYPTRRTSTGSGKVVKIHNRSASLRGQPNLTAKRNRNTLF